MRFARFDLNRIRGECSVLFSQWDALVANGRFEEAKHIRLRKLWPLLRHHLSDDALSFPGVYAFIDNSHHSGWPSISYIGQTVGSLRNRIDDYIKDDSAWDANLISDRTRVEETAFRRLRPVMPSTDEKLREHAAKHAATIRKTRGCSLFVAGFEPRETELIVPVEAALIAVSWSYGAPLENDKLERLPTTKQRSRVITLCEQIFAGCAEQGLNQELCRAAASALNSARGSSG